MTFPEGKMPLSSWSRTYLSGVGRELGVRREHDRGVSLALVEHRVSEPDVDRVERLELQAVDVLQADQAVCPLAAFR
jgi:hypothetical protein